jgi:hypothetical protein
MRSIDIFNFICMRATQKGSKKSKEVVRAVGVAQVVEHLPSICEALVPQQNKKKTKHSHSERQNNG